MPPFSVLMSVYYKENPAFLQESLDSIFNQSLKPDEIVLVQDGPLTSELYDTIKKYSRLHPEIKSVVLAKNSGLGNALNEGLKYCSHDIVFRMDTDDIAKPNRFQTQLEFMASRPDISVCSSWVEEFEENINNIKGIKKVPQNHEDIFIYGKNRCPVNHPAVVFRKQDVINSGGYGQFPEDYSLWARMLMNGFKFHNIQESLLWFRSSKDVYKRRGGIKYLKAILKLNKEMYKIGYISYLQYSKLFIIRSIVSLVPNSLRSFVYKKLLRSSN